jgi:amino acid adenylation domain-containing protein
MPIRHFLQVQLDRDPHAIAIKDAVAELTYQQLHHQINQLANYLCRQGITADCLVGIYADRSIDLVVAILAVLQAGAAYVPLDPTYPQSRLSSILVEAKLSLILTQSHLAPDLQTTGTELFLLDTQRAEISNQSVDLTPAPTTSANLAYIMYTSGSTGKPQGVQITIGQVESYIQALSKIVKIRPDDIYLHSASFSFSSSLRQLLIPLAQGAKVVITSNQDSKNLSNLLQLIKAEQITVFDTVASVWNYLLLNLSAGEQAEQIQLIDSQLRLLIFSGGLLTAQLLDQIRSRFPQPPQIINIYGQTETIGVCAYPVPSDFQATTGCVPVGLPYDHNQLYLLDDRLQPVATGTTGELHVAGSSLARGYLNNPDLTDRKFIANPFSTDRQYQRLYKTGDLARYLPDGNLEIVGRQDFQVKIRGMRVEIEEIETVLMEHPDVQQAAVIGKKDRAGEQIIVAYIVANHWKDFCPEQLQLKVSGVRSFLKTKLTDYMMPSALEILDALPLTPNNKIDRQNLPEPSRQNIFGTAPRDAVEVQLVKIWERILNLKQVGIHDSFFDLGGHSLIALQMFTDIEQIWHKRLLLSTLFESTTIAEIANLIRDEESTPPWSPLVLIKSGENQQLPLFCIHPLGGNLFNYHTLSEKLALNRPIYGLQAQGLDGGQQPLDRIEAMASYFIQAIRTVQPQGPYFILGYSFGGIVSFDIARQLTEQGEKIAFLGLLDIRSPTITDITTPFIEWLNIQIARFQQLTFKQHLKYFVDKIFYRKKTDYRSGVASALIDLNLRTPELLNILDSNIKAKQRYQPQPYSGQADLFWSEYQDWYIKDYPDLGWGNLITGGLHLQWIPGDHDSLMQEPHVQVLAEKLRLSIEQASENIITVN